jgi:uncharacterized membrane protein
MGEERSLAGLIAVTLALGLVATVIALWVPTLTLSQGLSVDTYEADYALDGSLEERYVYNVEAPGTYRMLFRTFDVPLVFNATDSPHFELVGVEPPDGVTGYARDSSGAVRLFGDAADPGTSSFVSSLAELNEVGLVDTGYFSSGTYEGRYAFTVRPPVEYDDSFVHVNLRLARTGQHVPYSFIRITLPADGVSEVFAYPPTLQQAREGDRIVITGSAGENEDVAIELLLERSTLEAVAGFPRPVDDLEGQTRSAHFWETVPYWISTVLYWAGIAFVLVVPLALLLLYRRYGREKAFTVPEYLSTVPDPGKPPWTVNLLFKGDAGTSDADGFYATVLDLHRRGLIRVEEIAGGEDVRILLKGARSNDPYEQRVLDFLAAIATDPNVVDTAALQLRNERAKTDTALQSEMIRNLGTYRAIASHSDPAVTTAYTVSGREHVLPLALVGAALAVVSLLLVFVFPSLSGRFIGPILLFVVGIAQSGLAIASPSTLFGHWKGEGYRERLEWEAFAHFLSDLAMLRKYSPADLSMWGEWLVYGTALGVGDKVARAMRELNIRLPEEMAMPTHLNTAFVPLLLFAPPIQSSGGGFGGGGLRWRRFRRRRGLRRRRCRGAVTSAVDREDQPITSSVLFSFLSLSAGTPRQKSITATNDFGHLT